MQVDISKQLKICKDVAISAHQGQMRQDGETPYIKHIEKVVEIVGSDKYRQCIAWLHDVIEDNPLYTAERLIELGVDSNIVARVLVLTHINGTYNDYIKLIKDTTLTDCRQIKVADICANLSDTPSKGQIKKYYNALRILVR